MFTAITHTDNPRTEAIVQRMMVTAKGSGIRFHTFRAMVRRSRKMRSEQRRLPSGIRLIIISHLLLRVRREDCYQNSQNLGENVFHY